MVTQTTRWKNPHRPGSCGGKGRALHEFYDQTVPVSGFGQGPCQRRRVSRRLTRNAGQAFIAEELRQHADYVIAAHWGDVWLDEMGLASAKT